MAKSKNSAEMWVNELANLCANMPRGPQNETAIIRLIARHAPDAGDAMVFLTSMADRGDK